MRFRPSRPDREPSRGWLDRAIEAVSPQWAAERQATRIAILEAQEYERETLRERERESRISAHFGGGTGAHGHLGPYQGGRKGAPNSAWDPLIGSADADILPQLPVLRDRCRELLANNGSAVAMVGSLCDNIVGEGMTPEARPDAERLGLTPQQAKELQEDLSRVWNDWKPFADVAGVDDLDTLQELWIREAITAGDVFIRPVRTRIPGATLDLALETIEPERVDSPIGIRERIIRGGVETSRSSGAPVAYWIHRQHPKDISIALARGSRRMVRIPRYDIEGRIQVIHYYNRHRPQQSRGVPWLAPSLVDFKDLNDWKRAEMFAAKVSACLTGIITNTSGKQFWKPKEGDDGTPRREFRPGQWITLRPGQDVKVVDPSRPNQNFETYSDAALRTIGGSVGLPIEIALRNFSKSSWSNARAAVMEARKMFRKLSDQFARKVLTPIWFLLMEEAYRRGMLRHLQEWDPNLLRPIWHHAGWGWVDPEKQAKAAILKLDAKLTTKERILRELGDGSHKDLIDQLLHERQTEEEAGLSSATLAPAPPGSGPDEPDEDREDDEDVPQDDDEEETEA